MNHYLEQAVAFFDPATVRGAVLLGLAMVLGGIVGAGLIHRGLRAVIVHDHSQRIDQIALSFLSRLLILGLWLVLATVYAHLVPALNRLGTALLAGVGLASVVIGFAAQTTLGNLVSGISLVLYKPFRKGDRLAVMAPTADQCEIGVVEDITLGFTSLRTDDGRLIIIANGAMAQQAMIKLPPAGQGPTTGSAAGKPS
ncbi:MAG: mechanosensitive ion channel [Caulobacterales bacterium]|nr:mechanosensitive ion channel [Caulobacterales bacterium]